MVLQVLKGPLGNQDLKDLRDTVQKSVPSRPGLTVAMNIGDLTDEVIQAGLVIQVKWVTDLNGMLEDLDTVLNNKVGHKSP